MCIRDRSNSSSGAVSSSPGRVADGANPERSGTNEGGDDVEGAEAVSVERGVDPVGAAALHEDPSMMGRQRRTFTLRKMQTRSRSNTKRKWQTMRKKRNKKRRRK